MTLSKAIPDTENKLTFKVVKTTKETAKVESAPYDYQIPAQPPPSRGERDSGTVDKTQSSN